LMPVVQVAVDLVPEQDDGAGKRKDCGPNEHFSLSWRMAVELAAAPMAYPSGTRIQAERELGIAHPDPVTVHPQGNRYPDAIEDHFGGRARGIRRCGRCLLLRSLLRGWRRNPLSRGDGGYLGSRYSPAVVVVIVEEDQMALVAAAAPTISGASCGAKVPRCSGYAVLSTRPLAVVRPA